LFFEIIFIDTVNIKLWGRDRFLEENRGRGPKKIENHWPRLLVLNRSTGVTWTQSSGDTKSSRQKEKIKKIKNFNKIVLLPQLFCN
jgi:hypothetical protein